jgi:hypothetical protein
MAVGMLLGYLPFLMIAGGRYNLLVCLLEFGVILWIKSGLQPLRPRRVILWSSFIFLNILIVSAFRYASESIGSAAIATFLSFSMRILRVSQTAWIADNMPGNMDFTGIQNGLLTFDDIVPGLAMGHLSLIRRVLNHLYPSSMSESLSVPTFSNAAELYSWAGIPSIVFFGLIYGALFSFLFRCTCRRPTNPYWLLLSFMTLFEVFFSSLAGRMPEALRNIPFIIVVLVTLAIIAEKLKTAGKVYLGSITIAILTILAWRFTHMEFMKWASMSTIIFIYLAAFAYFRHLPLGESLRGSHSPPLTDKGQQIV